jgi:hypothetical protein
VALRNISLLVQKHPSLLTHDVKVCHPPWSPNMRRAPLSNLPRDYLLPSRNEMISLASTSLKPYRSSDAPLALEEIIGVLSALWHGIAIAETAGYHDIHTPSSSLALAPHDCRQSSRPVGQSVSQPPVDLQGPYPDAPIDDEVWCLTSLPYHSHDEPGDGFNRTKCVHNLMISWQAAVLNSKHSPARLPFEALGATRIPSCGSVMM